MPYTLKQLEKNKRIMSLGNPVDVQLVLHDGKRSDGTVRVQSLSESEAKKVALKFFFTCFAACFVMVILPPHLLWVIALLTVGTVGYIVKSKQLIKKLGGQAVCAKCNAFQILEPGNYELPFIHYCEECRQRMDVYKRGEVPEELYQEPANPV